MSTNAIPHLSGGATIASASRPFGSRDCTQGRPANAALRAARDAAKDTAGNAEVKFVKEYWKALGFIRRDAADNFIEQEQDWH